MTSDVAEKHRKKRFYVMIAAMVVTDAIWFFYSYSSIIEVWEGTNIDKLFFQFGAAGMIFFAAFVFMGLSDEDRPRKVFRGSLLGVYIVCLLSTFLSCLAVELIFGGALNVKTIVICVNLILNIVMIVIMYVIGFVSVPSEKTPHQKRVLAAGLGIIIAVMTLVFIYISLKDMGALNFIMRK